MTNKIKSFLEVSHNRRNNLTSANAFDDVIF